MLRIVIIASVASFAVAELTGIKCDAKALGANPAAFMDLGNRSTCICKNQEDCGEFTVRIGEAHIDVFALGKWEAVVEDNHFKILKAPIDFEGRIYSVGGDGYVIYILCTGDTTATTSYVEFESKADATPKVLEELKSKFNTEIDPEALSGCF